MKLSKTFISVAAILVLLVAGILSGCVPPVPEVIEVTEVSITEEDQSMKVDETLQLTTVLTPEDATNKAITWESDNPDVAIVDENGLVTALSAGVANITVTTDDGAFIDTIKITVTKPYTPSTPTPTIKKYKVNFGAYLIPEEIPAGLTSSRGDDPEPNLAEVEIEIFSDEARTDRVTTVTTDENGMATIKLPNGTYYFIANRERYICAPIDEISVDYYEVITLPTTIATLTVQGTFTISNEDISDTILIIAQEAYVVTFLATEGEIQSTGISRISDPIPVPTTPLVGVTIEIYLGGDGMGISTLERTAEEPPNEFKITTLTTNSDGIARVYLPNGLYAFTADKEGYAYFPLENTSSSIQRAVQKGYFEVIGADITDTNPIQVPMKQVYALTVAEVVGGTATVTADLNTDILGGETVTVTISNIETVKTFISIEVVGNDSDIPQITTVVTEGEEYTFLMPNEDVTVTVTIDDICLAARYIYNEGDYYGYNWVRTLYNPNNSEYSVAGEYLYLKAWLGDDGYPKLIGIFNGQSKLVYIGDCINSIVIDWENTGSDSNTNESYLVVASSLENISNNNYDKQLFKQNNFGRTTDKLDVSELTTSSYYVGVIAKVQPGGMGTDYSEIKVHSIELSQIK